MGPLLRGPIDDEQLAGPKKEAAIVEACTRDHWSPAVLSCVASATEPTAKDCLAALPAELHAHYEKAIEKYAQVEEDEGDNDAHVGDDPTDDGPTTCNDAFAATSVDLWPPEVAADTERKIAAKLRVGPLRALCEDQHWDSETTHCIAHTPASNLDPCLELLGTARNAEITHAIDAADKLRARITTAKPATATCEKVVAVHYADAKWKGQDAEVKGSARTKAIAAKRKAMLAQCKAGNWSIEARACIVVADRDECYALPGVQPGSWGYSLGGTTGIAECDAYRKAMDELANCPSLPAETRKALLDSFEELAASWKGIPAEALEATKAACKAGADAMKEAARGCT
jgi:hypothetical protein